ncbi:cell division protein FtsQ/DivIB [Kineosporia succinea]|uniref:Cell division protein FtsQ n=1 Tax=Kineosporia succinea TaxID=84632 RepID=A0ABT9P776_9ACTN|nr:FtsQ-type POTRA domain-containing protein [Kineosporia succinea]MDP9828302.1 cell division protein FtsQ [Kineosporia succinea]
MTPSSSSSGPGRRPARGPAGRGSSPRRKPSPPASSGKSSSARKPPKPAAQPPKPPARQQPAKKQPAARKPPAAKKQPAAKKPAARKPATGRPGVRRPVTASRSAGLLPPPTRPVVSQTSAQRFAAKVRARRRRRTLTTSLVVVVLAGVGWLALLSPWAKVERVTVSGLDRISESQVRGYTDTEIGHAMLLARTSDVSARLEKLRLVKNVSVSRVWPGTIRVVVTERKPVAALPSEKVAANTTDGKKPKKTVQMMQLVDDEGVVVETRPVSELPGDLPRIEVALGEKQSVANLRGTLAVLNDLPDDLADRLRSIGTDSPDGIWLKLSAPVEGAKNRTVTVRWGDAEQNGTKARVLTALLKQKAKTYDVRAPEMPSTAS